MSERRKEIAQELAASRGDSLDRIIDLAIGRYIDENGTPEQRRENSHIWKTQEMAQCIGRLRGAGKTVQCVRPATVGRYCEVCSPDDH